MRPTELRLKPDLHTPNIKLQDLIRYPQLQKRINNAQFQVSGVHNLIVQLKKEAIQELKQEFISNNNNVNLQQFVWLISNSLQVSVGVGKGSPDSMENQYYQYEIEYELVKAFQEIDIDDSNSISWEEYIEYITSSSLIGIASSDPDEQPVGNTPANSKEVTFSHREKTTFRKTSIRKILELERQKMLAVLESKTDTLSFISIDGSLIQKQPQLQGIDCNKVLSIDYSEDDRMFGLLMSNHMVVFIEDGEMQKSYGENKFSGDEVEIMYLRKHKLWVLISLNHSIQIFKPPRGRIEQQLIQRPIFIFKPHEKSFLGLKELHNPLSICTASLQGELKLWSLSLNRLLIEINPCKEEDFLKCKAIKGFQAFNQASTTFILCWMFSSEISVWLPSSSLSKPYLGKLKGHIGIVEEAKFLHNVAMAISIDNKFSIRVWDVPKLQCLQTWKIESISHPNIQILRSVPYAVFYDKTMDFYRLAKQCEMIDQNNKIKNSKQKVNTTDPKNKQVNKKNFAHRTSLRGKLEKKVTNMNKKQEKKKIKFTDALSESSVESFESSESISNVSKVVVSEEDVQELPRRVFEVLYDEYFDCFLVMQEKVVKIVAVNSGIVLNSIKANDNGESFVSMTLKEHRRLFLANNFGDIGYFRLEDCCELYRLHPFKDIQLLSSHKISDIEGRSHKIFDNQSREKNQANFKGEYRILAIQYNTINEVLLVVGECEENSIVITHNNFSCPETSKKKQIVFDQKNLRSFASSKKYNLFFVASNKPELISIWDYHNFNVIRTIEIKLPIHTITSDNSKFNMLIVTSHFEIRIIRFNGIDAKNNMRFSDNMEITKNIVKCEFIMRSHQRVLGCRFILVQNKEPAKLAPKSRVRFQDDTDPQHNTQTQQKGSHKFGIYVAAGDTLYMTKTSFFIDMNDTLAEPLHLSKPNISKQTKFVTLTPHKWDSGTQKISINELILETVTSFKQNIDAMGYVKEMIYFTTKVDVLNFYTPSDCQIRAKMSLPNLEIINWGICIKLVDKILARMLKAENTSRQIYVYKKNKPEHTDEQTYLRTAFLLNKYFTFDDIQDIQVYFNHLNLHNARNKKSEERTSQNFSDPIFKMNNGIPIDNNNKESSVKNFFNQRYEDRNRIRSQTAQKMKEIEKKYSRAFSYIKNKYPGAGQVQQKTKKSKEKTSTNKMQSKSISNFKIRNTASSANKLFVHQSKQIKECLKKLGVLNRETNLKL